MVEKMVERPPDSGLSGALFWDEGQEVDPDDPDLAALLALQEEVPAPERAEAFKARFCRLPFDALRARTAHHVSAPHPRR
jgi:hypothetical protein